RRDALAGLRGHLVAHAPAASEVVLGVGSGAVCHLRCVPLPDEYAPCTVRLAAGPGAGHAPDAGAALPAAASAGLSVRLALQRLSAAGGCRARLWLSGVWP